MKKAILFWLTLISLMTACADSGTDYLPTDDESDTQGTAWLTLSLALGTGSGAGTRSQTGDQGDSNHGTEAGTKEENLIKDAIVVFGKIADGMNDPLEVEHSHFIREFTMTGNNPALWTSKPIACKPGKYRLAVIANPGTAVTFQDGNRPPNWSALANYGIDYSVRGLDSLKTIWGTDTDRLQHHFLMSSAFTGDRNFSNVELEAGRHAYKTLQVQRACARFDYIPQTARTNRPYTFGASSPHRRASEEYTIEVSLTEAALMNISNTFNLFKLVSADESPGTPPDFYQHETVRNYVYDYDWNLKRLAQQVPLLANTLFFCSSTVTGETGHTTQPLEWVKLPEKEGRLFYCSENTLPGMKVQIHALSTAVVFKAYFRATGSDNRPVEEPVIYFYDGKLYTSLTQLTAELPELGYQPTDQELARYEVKKFMYDAEAGGPGVGGYPMYYTYWNRHNDNGDNHVMGNMEFAVVRNNVYKLQVNSIRSFGLPMPPNDPDNPWKPDNQTPDEQSYELDITVTVNDWVDRSIDHEI